jgi:hypothetical protein
VHYVVAPRLIARSTSAPPAVRSGGRGGKRNPLQHKR